MIGQSAGKSFAYILGVYLGDGCVTKSGANDCFRLNTIDIEFATATRVAFLEYGPLTANSLSVHAVKKSSKPNCALSIRQDDICRTLVDDTERKIKIPDYVFEWPRENQLAFITGLMDSEGFVGANSNPTNRRYYMGFKSCDAWVPEFIELLESVGVRIGKVQTEKPLQPHYKPPTRFTIKMQSWIDAGCRFNIQRKQGRVEEWKAAGAYERRAKNPRRLTSETICSEPKLGP